MESYRPSKCKHEWIGKQLRVIVDRPIGSVHPTHSHLTYGLNYGYVPDTVAADGHEIDAYLLGLKFPVEEYLGHCIAIIHRKNDVEDKLVVAPFGEFFSDGEILAQTHFQEQFFTTTLIR